MRHLEETERERAEGTPRQVQRETRARRQTAHLPSLKSQVPTGQTGLLNSLDRKAEGEKAALDREGKIGMEDETVPARPKGLSQRMKMIADGRKPSILIVEDTEELAEVIQATLESKDMQVQWVSRGKKGLEQIKAQVPDILLLDIGLPDITGWEMLEELRNWKKSPDDLPTIVVITAYSDPANRLIGKLQGIHSYLIKPFTANEVEQVIEGVLGQA